MPTAVISEDGTIQIPKDFLTSHHWSPGTFVELSVQVDGVKIESTDRPKFDLEKIREIQERMKNRNWDLTRKMIEEGRSEC